MRIGTRGYPVEPTLLQRGKVARRVPAALISPPAPVGEARRGPACGVDTPLPPRLQRPPLGDVDPTSVVPRIGGVRQRVLLPNESAVDGRERN